MNETTADMLKQGDTFIYKGDEWKAGLITDDSDSRSQWREITTIHGQLFLRNNEMVEIA